MCALYFAALRLNTFLEIDLYLPSGESKLLTFGPFPCEIKRK